MIRFAKSLYWSIVSRGTRQAQRGGANVHQLRNDTELNRYPEVFQSVADYFKTTRPTANPAVLSFGCSDGSECQTLRQYMPAARIVGADVNRKLLARAIRKCDDLNTTILFSTPDNIRRLGPYDAIFAMSVLCRWPQSRHVNDLSSLYRFDQFQDTLLMLDQQLTVGGLLVVVNANFRFRETSLFPRYSVHHDPRVTTSGNVHKFAKDHRKLVNYNDDECIFIRQKQ